MPVISQPAVMTISSAIRRGEAAVLLQIQLKRKHAEQTAKCHAFIAGTEQLNRVSSILAEQGLSNSATCWTIEFSESVQGLDSSFFDLPIALVFLAAGGHIDPARLDDWLVAGALSPLGSVGSVLG